LIPLKGDIPSQQCGTYIAFAEKIFSFILKSDALFFATRSCITHEKKEITPMPRNNFVVLATPIAALFLMGISTVHAADMARPGGEKTAFCEQCHGPKGCVPLQGLIPKLGGQNAEYLEVQLMEFRSGARPQPIMHATASQLSVELVKQLAVYYSKMNCSQK
jgi:cytochrome c553